MPAPVGARRTTGAGRPGRRTYTAPVTDDTNEPPAGVPMRKAAGGRPDSTAPAPRPRTVTYAVGALALAALFSIITAIGWSTQRDWVKTELHKSNVSAAASAVSSATASAAKKSQDVAKASASASSSFVKKHPISGSKLDDQVGTQVQSVFISGLFGVLILGFLAYGAYRGRHWTRWGVVGFYVIATLTGVGVGLLTLVTSVVGSGAPQAIRIPTLLASLAMLVAVVLVNLRPSVDYFALSRPAPRAGAAPRRGLFGGPRPARPGQPQRAANGRSTPATTRPATPATPPATPAKDADRQRAKKRATADSVARGAELARSRAKASKSRRTER